jgi:cellulose synthase/poly-beta-1,6-N-acetylglucosamine synthase-like glycosyltransferase
MAVHNEEAVLKEKLESIFDTSYPANKFELIIGSDSSTDTTNSLLDVFSKQYHFRYILFDGRMGKPNVMNTLSDLAKGEVLILTDANVIFEKPTLFELARHFNDPAVGLVDSNMVNTGRQKQGISFQESAYISIEVQTKYCESRVFGAMMGPFGGCFAMRRNLYRKVPSTLLVDDFFLNMKVVEQGYKAINALEAKVYEDVSNIFREEFRRKVRISTGNFQNLQLFGHLLLNPFRPVAFCFLSHKVLRWLTPFFLLAAFVLNLWLAFSGPFYMYLLAAQSLLYIVPVVEYLLRKIEVHIVPLRYITHFVTMNIALFMGFVNYLKGVESNVWKPTQRNQ